MEPPNDAKENSVDTIDTIDTATRFLLGPELKWHHFLLGMHDNALFSPLPS
jgi:hypothetical protein